MGLSAGGAYQLGSGLVSLGAGMFGKQQQQTNMFDIMSGPYQALLAQQQDNYNQEAALYEQQAQIAQDEAAQTAEAKAREGQRAMQDQANQYNASGVLLEGSPLAVLDETRRLAQQEVDAIMRRGSAQSALYRRQGALIRNKGRADILGANIDYQARAMQNKIESQRPSNNDIALQQLGQALGQVKIKIPKLGGLRTPAPSPSPLTTIHGMMKP